MLTTAQENVHLYNRLQDLIRRYDELRAEKYKQIKTLEATITTLQLENTDLRSLVNDFVDAALLFDDDDNIKARYRLKKTLQEANYRLKIKE